MSPIQESGPLRAFRPPTAFAITKNTALDGSGCAPSVCVWGGARGGWWHVLGCGWQPRGTRQRSRGLRAGLGFPMDRRSWQGPEQGVYVPAVTDSVCMHTHMFACTVGTRLVHGCGENEVRLSDAHLGSPGTACPVWKQPGPDPSPAKPPQAFLELPETCLKEPGCGVGAGRHPHCKKESPSCSTPPSDAPASEHL